MDAKKIGACIKRNRIKYEMSIEELARQAEIDIEQIIKYENGDEIPKYKELVALSKAIQVPIGFLVKGGGKPICMCVNENGERVCRLREY